MNSSNKVNRANFVRSDSIESLVGPPVSAGTYFGEYLERNKITPTAAARVLKVNQSTVKRFIDGAQLSETMAAKIKQAYRIEPEILMKLDAKYHAYNANQMAKEKQMVAEVAVA